MATTTEGAIRRQIIALVRALEPTVDSHTPFRPHSNEGEANFRRFCRQNPLGVTRTFQVRKVSTRQPPDACNTDVSAQLVTFDLIVAYAQSHRWGADAALDRDDAMEADQVLIEHAIGRDGYGNFAGSNPNASWIGSEARGSQTGTSVERDQGVDFLVVRQTMRFYRSQT